MIVKDEFSFGNDKQKQKEKKDCTLTDEDRNRMQTIKKMYGPMPDRVVEISLIKKHPQLLQPFIFMIVRIIQAFANVFIP